MSEEDIRIERELERLGDVLVRFGTTREQRRAIWEEIRGLHRMRSAERIAQMERDQGLTHDAG